MKKLALLAAAAIVGVSMFAVPADAGGRHGPIRGSVDIQFNMGVVFGVGVAEDPDTNVSHIGDIRFRGRDYTAVWFNVTPPGQTCTVCYAEETWRIYDSADYEFGIVSVPGVGDLPGVLTSFVPGELVFEGSDRAIGTSGNFMGWGPVTDVGPAADGPFEHMTGGHVFWYGSFDTDPVGPGTRFEGRFTVFPQFDD